MRLVEVNIISIWKSDMDRIRRLLGVHKKSYWSGKNTKQKRMYFLFIFFFIILIHLQDC